LHKKIDLISDLKKMGINQKGTLMVHMSYKSIGDVDGRGDTVIDALIEYMKDGLLVLPAHTWSNVGEKNPVMDVLYTPSCVGAMTELFRKKKAVIRSLHPTHSLAAIGADSKLFLSGEEQIKTPCGKDGAYYKLWERDAQILLIGVNFSSNTFIHGVEEWDGAEGSISANKTDLYVIDYEGRRIYTPQYRHCSVLGSDTFTKLEDPAIQKGILRFGKFGDSTTRIMSTKQLREMTAVFLRDDPRYLLRY